MTLLPVPAANLRLKDHWPEAAFSGAARDRTERRENRTCLVGTLALTRVLPRRDSLPSLARRVEGLETPNSLGSPHPQSLRNI